MNPSRTVSAIHHIQPSNSLKDVATKRMNIRRISEEDEKRNIASSNLGTIPARITSTKTNRENHDHSNFTCSDSHVESILKAAYEQLEK